MKLDNKHIVFMVLVALCVCLLPVSVPTMGEPTNKVDQTIQYLIEYVSGSGLKFIRNAREYTPGEAAEHMNKKYQYFKDDIETPENFIELCATKSLLSGKPYLVVDRRGIELKTGDWLKTELRAYQERNR